MTSEEEREREISRLCHACVDGKWDIAKTIIAKDPLLACGDAFHSFTPVIAFCMLGKVEMLQYIEDAIFAFFLQYPHPQQQQQLQEVESRQQQMLRDAFERGDNFLDGHACTFCCYA
jgi:hypothetical protein